MCIGVPRRLVSVDGIVGRCDGDSAVDLSLLSDCRPGDWVLSFLGTARRALDAEEARLILDALDAIAALQGGDTRDAAGDATLNADAIAPAFADLVDRQPTLPPHLAAAHAAGRSEA